MAVCEANSFFHLSCAENPFLAFATYVGIFTFDVGLSSEKADAYP
jgi:hypothetical protein